MAQNEDSINWSRQGDYVTRLRYRYFMIEIDYLPPTVWEAKSKNPKNLKRRFEAYWRIRLWVHTKDNPKASLNWTCEYAYTSIGHAESDALALANTAVPTLEKLTDWTQGIRIPRPDCLLKPIASRNW